MNARVKIMTESVTSNIPIGQTRDADDPILVFPSCSRTVCDAECASAELRLKPHCPFLACEGTSLVPPQSTKKPPQLKRFR